MPAPPLVEPPDSSSLERVEDLGLLPARRGRQHQPGRPRVDHDRHAVVLAEVAHHRPQAPTSAAGSLFGSVIEPETSIRKTRLLGGRPSRSTGLPGQPDPRQPVPGAPRAGRAPPPARRSARRPSAAGRRTGSNSTSPRSAPRPSAATCRGRGTGGRWRSWRCPRRPRTSTAARPGRGGTGCRRRGRNPPCWPGACRATPALRTGSARPGVTTVAASPGSEGSS